MRGSAKQIREKITDLKEPLRGEVTIVLSGLGIQPQDLKDNILKEELTRPVNIIEIAWKMND